MIQTVAQHKVRRWFNDQLALPGWHLVGRYPDGDPDGVGSWLLHHDGDALLLEVPPGLSIDDISEAIDATGTSLHYMTASHIHEDHLDRGLWREIKQAGNITVLRPSAVKKQVRIFLQGEPLWILPAPKHSANDVVVVFRGVAMTGDIELGTLDSVNQEVSMRQKRESMESLRLFQQTTGYHVHTVVSAHLNDVRRGVDWKSLFTVEK